MDYYNHFIESYVHNGGIGVLIELDVSDSCATRTDEFKSLAKDLAMQVGAMNPSSVDDLLSQPFIKDPERTVDQRIAIVAQTLQSKIAVRRFVRWNAEPQGPSAPEPPRTPAVIYDLRKAR
jgi:elongation factor Ts